LSRTRLSGAESFDSQSVDINVKPVADDYNIDAQGSGIEDAVIAMPISLSSSDSDGSESIVGDEVRVTLENGGELSVDNNSDSFIDNGDGTYTMSQADLSHLQFTGPENQHGTFNVSVDFNTQDSSSSDTSSIMAQHKDFSIVVESRGDGVSLDVDADSSIVVDEGSEPIDLGLSVALQDSDGSEYGFIVVNGVPEGASLTNGYASHNADGTSTWTISQADAPNTAIKFDENFNNEEFNLGISAQRLDTQSGDLISTDAVNVAITVNPLTDGVTLHNSYTQGLEDTSFDMNLSFSMGNMDGSETLNFTFNDIPEGSSVNYTSEGQVISATPNADGSVTLDGISFDEASSLTFTPPTNMSGHIDIDMSVASVDTAGSLVDISDTVSADLSIDVIAVSSGFDGEGMSVNISDYTPTDDGLSVDDDVTGISVADADGSETLTLNIQGLGESAEVTFLNGSGEVQEANVNSNGDWSISFNPATDDYATIMQTITINAKNADDLEGDINFSATVTESSNGSSTTIFNSVNVADFVADKTLGEDTHESTRSINKDVLFDLNETLPDTESENEKLGTIEIGLPSGAELNYANGESVAISNGVASISIVIVNDLGELDESVHASDQSLDNAIAMTQSEFESLQVTPPDNFSGEMNIDTSYSAYEVDNSNNIIEGIDPVSVTNSESITVENIIEGTDADDYIAGTDTAESIEAGAGNDTIIFDASDDIDGGEGLDSLLATGDMNIDFSALDGSISNIETINLGEGSQNITSISVEDVLEITSDSVEHTLRIDGDESDSIDLNIGDSDSEWTLGGFKTDAETGEMYQEVTGGEGDSTVTLEISTDIEILES